MNLIRSLLRLFAIAVPLLAGRAADPAADPALKLLDDSVVEMMAVIYEPDASGGLLSARLRPVLEKYFDFEYATRSAIGPGWRQFSPEQQTRTVELFTDLVIRTYADRFQPTSRPTIVWGKPVTPAAKRREVPSTVTYEGESYSVAYKLRETVNGWRVYDVVAENVSMIANYRAQFDDMFKKGGADAVVRSLEDNLREVSASPTP